MSIRIKLLLEATAPWYVVTHDRDSGKGALFRRVACWAVVVDPDGGDDRVVAMFPELDGQAMLDHYRFDHPDVVGLAEPGDDRAVWGDAADERLRAEREDEARKEHAELAPRLAKLLMATDQTALRAMLGGDKAMVPSDTNLVELAELGLVNLWKPSSDEPRHDWVVTALGRAVVAELDNHKR
jgi:hypothetical protein